MPPVIFFSSTSFKSETLESLLNEARCKSIRNLELTGNVSYKESDFDLLRGEAKNFNFSLHNYCLNTGAPFILNLAAGDSAEREHVLTHLKRIIDFASIIGCSHYGIHWGYAFKSIYGTLGGGGQFSSEKRSLEDARQLFYLGLEELIPYAQAAGIKLLIENNSFSFFDGIRKENEICLGVSVEEMMELVSRFTEDELGLLLDVAHATVCENTLGLDFFQKDWPIDRIEWVHVSKPSTYIDSNLPLDADVYYPLKKLDKLRGITIEVNHFDEIDYADQISRVEQLFL